MTDGMIRGREPRAAHDAGTLDGQPGHDEVIGVLRALADPNRLRIFDFLMQGDSCNCELNENLGLPANLLSHHLRVLREAGLINSRRDAIDGRWIYYSVDRGAIRRWRTWFGWLLDPERVQERAMLCGPEGMLTAGSPQGALVNSECASPGRERRCRSHGAPDCDFQ
jgi:ArsR family transcriptional regulator